jgi:hypothetical protein
MCRATTSGLLELQEVPGALDDEGVAALGKHPLTQEM